MSNKYFEYILVIVFGISVILPLWQLYLHIRLQQLQKLVRLRVMKRQQKSESNTFFSSVILNRCCKILFYKSDKNARSALAALVAGRVQKTIDYFAFSQPELALLAEAHFNAIGAYKKLLKQKKIIIANMEYCAYLPVLAYVLFDNNTAHKLISQINPQKLKKSTKAYYNYCAAAAYLFDGDMLSASQKVSAALKYFQKQKYSYETSQCYLLLGEIYRLSCVNDVAQTMIEAAVKINKEQKMPQFAAKSTAALGMLMLFESRYEEAEAKFDEATKLAVSTNLRADIHNQKALFYIAQNNYEAAQTEIKNAATIFEQIKNTHSMAFSLQLDAQINFSLHKYGKALVSAQKAIFVYEKNHNISAVLECMYLSADILVRQNKTKKAEELLRQIIEKDKKQKHNFHIANAYSLLGLIYLHKKDLQRAKVLLQQSLHLEQRHHRCEGLVSDYANLALIENLSGNHNIAAENLQTALEYASQTGNNDIVSLIKKKIDNL